MRRPFDLASALILTISSCACALAQAKPSANPSDGTPERAYISATAYTNAFFGFSLTLPHGVPFRQWAVPSADSTQRFLFGVQVELIKGAFSPHAAASVMEIMCKQAGEESAEEAQKFVAGKKNLKATHIGIAGRDFWKSEAEENGKAGKMHSINYAAPLGEYAVEFVIASFDSKLTGQLERSIESISFFDPSRAEEMAGPDSHLYDPSGGHIAKLHDGIVWSNTYTNDALGFTYEFPTGWIVADEATRIKVVESGHQAAYGDDPSSAQEHAFIQKCARYPLMVIRYPEGTKREGVNPLIALMLIDPACFPADFRFPSSLDNRERIAELSKAILSLLANAPFFGNGKNSVSAASDGDRVWIDLSSTANVEIPGTAPIAVFTVMAITEVRDYWVAWMFMAGSQNELDQLKRTPIFFSSPPR